MTTTEYLCRHFSRMGARLKVQAPRARQGEKNHRIVFSAVAHFASSSSVCCAEVVISSFVLSITVDAPYRCENRLTEFFVTV